MLITGWLFDVYPSSRGISIWLIDPEGRKHFCWTPFTPAFYLHVQQNEMEKAKRVASACPVPVVFFETKRTEIYSGSDVDVLEVDVLDTTRVRNAVQHFERSFPHFVFYNTDIPTGQVFLYHTRLFPLAYGEYLIDSAGKLCEFTLHDSQSLIEYSLPPLTIMSLRNADTFTPAKYRRTFQFEVSYDGVAYSLEQEHPADLVESLNFHLRRCDPDILVTEYGDAALLPMLVSVSEQVKVPLLLNRDTSEGYRTTKGSSYFQYGKIIHKDGAFELAGRWHIDSQNSFTLMESDFDGLFELSRITQISVQHQSRASIGNGLSSMQFSWAYRNGILIPSKKREPEDFKSAATLMLADRGGLVFQPPTGYHDEIGELDFVSIYPTIMVRHNVSPETINCKCCTSSSRSVPELEYRICDRREGIVPSTLRTVVERRLFYKKKKKELKSSNNPDWVKYDRRQTALKWMLVTCFGYLGYKNARFGKIEAHESVNAFSRDALLTAKEVAERAGFRLLHAIVDAL